jgi:hypothetical protein
VGFFYQVQIEPSLASPITFFESETSSPSSVPHLAALALAPVIEKVGSQPNGGFMTLSHDDTRDQRVDTQHP